MMSGRSYSSMRSVALLALAALTPLLILTTLVVPYYQKDEQRQLDEQLQRAAERAALSISRELHTQLELLTILAESPRLDDPLDVEGFALLVERLRVRLPKWSSIRVSDPDGRILMMSPPSNSPTSTVVDLPSHQKVVETAAPAVGQMIVGPGGNSGFAVRVPVIRKGAVANVLSAVLRPIALENALESTALQANWVSRVLDSADRVIAGKTGAVVDPMAASLPASWSGALDDQGFRTGYAMVDGADWRVVIGIPADVYRASEKVGYWIILASAAIVVALALLGATLLRRELTYRRQQAEIVARSHRFDALSKLAGGLSHDFNNLLMGLQSGLDQLSRRRTDEARFVQIMGLMRESLERGKASVQRLSGFTRRSDTGSEVLRLQDRFGDLIALLRQTVREDIVLDQDLDGAVWPIKVDPQALEIALVNLASNAQDAMPNGGELKLSIQNLERAERLFADIHGPHVHIGITDDGSGISAENIGRIFDPFFTTKGAGSAGLGLSQVYSFARRFGGAAYATSVPGVGTTINILLPAVRQQGPAALPKRPTPAFNQRVLVVDDDPIVAQGVAALLEGNVEHVEVAPSGAEGLRLLAERGFDTLITDITMPGMSGFDLANRAAQLQPGLHILLMTGYSEQLEQGAASRFQILAKPFARDTLLAAISQGVVPNNVVSIDRGR